MEFPALEEDLFDCYDREVEDSCIFGSSNYVQAMKKTSKSS
jgi:hypothetical protein